MINLTAFPTQQRLLQVKPSGWKDHCYHFDIVAAAPKERVWTWLNTPETFTEGQLPPYRVEFVSPDPDNIPAGFHEGVLNVHHGPLLNFAGVLNEIRAGEYRDLHYFYGSYAISLRFIRPTRLQFWVEELEPGITRVRGQVDSYVRPWLYRLWSWGQELFWGMFMHLLRRNVEEKITKHEPPR